MSESEMIFTGYVLLFVLVVLSAAAGLILFARPSQEEFSHQSEVSGAIIRRKASGEADLLEDPRTFRA